MNVVEVEGEDHTPGAMCVNCPHLTHIWRKYFPSSLSKSSCKGKFVLMKDLSFLKQFPENNVSKEKASDALL